ncbi:uncharacterized protein LOC144703700 [Wolffia australiana]
MAKRIVETVSSLMDACNKKITVITKKLSRQDDRGEEHKPSPSLTLRRDQRKAEEWLKLQRIWKDGFLLSSFEGRRKIKTLLVEGIKKKKRRGRIHESDGLWRRTILLGEKCRPLDFDGAIHYDDEGRRLEAPPRTPPRSPLRRFPFAA